MRKAARRPSVAWAFAPATVANVAVGFDILGLALEGLGEVVRVERVPEPRVSVQARGPTGPVPIPDNPRENTAGAGLLRMIEDLHLPFGFNVSLYKSIPIGSGLGGSSTSAVGAVVAANQLLRRALKPEQLLEYALTGEEVASFARHADNVAPCLRGGLVLVLPGSRLVQLPVPSRLHCAILLPNLSVKTREARGILSREVPLDKMIGQSARLGGFVAGCFLKDVDLMGECLIDMVIEPQRAHLVPRFADLRAAALGAGALGCSLSGSGPALFALTDGARAATAVCTAWRKVARAAKLRIVGAWACPVAKRGARVLRHEKEARNLGWR